MLITGLRLHLTSRLRGLFDTTQYEDCLLLTQDGTLLFTQNGMGIIVCEIPIDIEFNYLSAQNNDHIITQANEFIQGT